MCVSVNLIDFFYDYRLTKWVIIKDIKYSQVQIGLYIYYPYYWDIC